MKKSLEMIMEYVGFEMLYPDTEKFRADDKLLTLKEDSELKFIFFQDFFKYFGGKIEEPRRLRSLSWLNLLKDADDKSAISAICCEDLVVTELRDFYEKHKIQRAGPQGQNGPLLINGCMNIFHIRDINGIIRIVKSSWYGYAWLVKILGPNNNYRAYVDHRFFAQ